VKIAFLGHGNVGAPLADRLQRLGHQVTLAASGGHVDGAKALQARNPGLRIAPAEEATQEADAVFLAVPFGAVPEVLKPLASSLAGKVLVDCTNPVGPGLTHGLGSRQSGSELVQAQAPGARVVKAFSIYGFENLADPAIPGQGVRPVMMLCGEDAAAKATVAGLAGELGWQPLDVGGIAQALHLEHMTLLWIRMVRAGGQSPRTVWAVLGAPGLPPARAP
jgi:predicted dinucleotide-binding enzyme